MILGPILGTTWFYIHSRVMGLRKICVFNSHPYPLFYSLLDFTIFFTSGSQAWLQHLRSLNRKMPREPLALKARTPYSLVFLSFTWCWVTHILGMLLSGSWRVWFTCDSDDYLSFCFSSLVKPLGSFCSLAFPYPSIGTFSLEYTSIAAYLFFS